MFGIRKLKLSQQLYLLISFSICIIMLVNGIFYNRLSYKMVEQVKIYAEDTMRQLEFNLRSIIDGVKNFGFSFAYNKYVQEYIITNNQIKKIEIKDYIMDVIGYITEKSEHIAAVILIDKKGIMNILKSDDNTFYCIKLLEKSYNFYESGLKEPVFTSLILNQEKQYFFAYMVPMYYSGEDPEFRGCWIGTTIVLCNTSKFQSLIEQIEISKNTRVNLLDRNGKIIMSNDRTPWDSKINVELDKNNENIEQEKYIRTTCYIADIDCTIECKTPIIEVRDGISFFKDNLLLTAVIMIILLILIGIIINISITLPVVKIVNAIKEIGEKNLKQRINIKLDGDIGFIAKNINVMLDKVELMANQVITTQDKLYRTEILKKQAELSALQNQINPHFLYNTLECIRSIGIAFNIDEIVEISTAMADIFRYSIKSDDIVSVKDEVEIVKKYFKIIAIRFLGRIRMTIDINNEIINCRIPKMVLQPIVENAVYHGLEKKDNIGNLSIYGRIENDTLIFEVEDNGVGIEPGELERLNKNIEELDNREKPVMNKRCIGLANINVRIKLIFGSNYGLKVESKENIGTKVTIIFPKQLAVK